MIPQHSSSRHLLCFMFHSLGAETVKQAPGLHFGRVRSFYGSEPMHPSQCLLASPIEVADGDLGGSETWWMDARRRSNSGSR
jgi:hypothetical protein